MLLSLLTNKDIFSQTRQISQDQVYSTFPLSSLEENSRSTIENVYFPMFGDECTFDLVTLGVNNQWGRVSGMNGLGDLEKAQTLTFDGHDAYRIVGAMVWFERPAIVGDGTLICKIYTPHSDDGRPDRLIGQSDAIKSSEIIAPDDTMSYPTIFTFEHGAPILPDRPSFILSCDFSNLYSTFDTVVMLQTIDGCGDGGDSWELFSDGQTWTNIASSISWELNADFVMAAVVDFEDPTSDHAYIRKGDLQLYPPLPNPASDEIIIRFAARHDRSTHIKIFDQLGKLTRNINLGFLSVGDHRIAVQISDLTKGIYYYEVQLGTDRLLSRFIKK